MPNISEFTRRCNPIPMKFTRVNVPLCELERLYIEGASELALAKRYGIARSAIRPRLLACGIVPRNRSESMFVRQALASKEERQALAKAANEAMRGSTHSEEHRCKIAKTREGDGRFSSPAELLVAEWLRSAGYSVTIQCAVGRYSIDVAAGDSVAVEVNGGGWHAYGRHRARDAKKIPYFLDLGWNVLTIWVDKRKHPLTRAAKKYLIAFAERTSCNPTARGEHRVIWGDGAACGHRRFDLD